MEELVGEQPPKLQSLWDGCWENSKKAFEWRDLVRLATEEKDLNKVDADIYYQEPLDCGCHAGKGHPHLGCGAILTVVVFLSVISVV